MNTPHWVIALAMAPVLLSPAAAQLPPGCGAGKEVRQSGGLDATTIAGALAQLASPLNTDTCVVIRDTQTYSEQIEVLNFAFTYSTNTLKIMADPSFISSAPAVNPPALSTAAFWIRNSSVTIEHVRVVSTSAVSYGIWASSAYAAISDVVVESGGMIGIAGLFVSSHSRVIRSSVSVEDAHAGWVLGEFNTVSNSTFSNNSAAGVALYLYSITSSTVLGSNMRNQAGYAVWIHDGNHNTVAHSSMTQLGALTQAGVYIAHGSSNTITHSYIYSLSVGGILFDGVCDYNTVANSTITVSPVSNAPGMQMGSCAGTTVTRNRIVDGGGGGALRNFPDPSQRNDDAVIAYNYLSSESSVWPALYLPIALRTTVLNNFIQGSTAAYLSGSSNTVISGNVLIATGAFASAFVMANQSESLTLSDNYIQGGPLGAGIRIENSSGAIVLSSNTIWGGRFGVWIDTMAAGSFAISTMTFQSLSPGATALNFAGGTFISTFTGLNFSDTNIAVNLNAAQLSSSSRITLRSYSGARAGPAFENDPTGLIAAWGGANMPAGCFDGLNVKKDGSADFTTIQAALDGLGKSLGGDTCVVIRDTMTYSEQVTVQGFATNNFRLKIMSDPSFISSAPWINPPVASTAAFDIRNTSVTIQNLVVYATNPVVSAISIGSGNVVVSTVNIDDNSQLSVHGIFVSGSAIGVSILNSSITLNNSAAFSGIHFAGFGGGHMVAFSTVVGNSAYQVFFNGSSSNTFSNNYFRGCLPLSLYGDQNTISLSTMIATGCTPASAVVIFGSSNVINRTYLQGHAHGVTFSPSAAYNTVTLSTITTPFSDSNSLKVEGEGNTVANSLISASTGAFISGSTGTVLSANRIVSLGSGPTAHGVRMTNGAVNLTMSYNTIIAGAQAAAVSLDPGNSGLVSLVGDAIGGGQFGLSIATMSCPGSCGGNISISNLRFSGGLAAGATAIHFLGGTFVSTFTGVDFSDSNIAVNVNVRPLSSASRLTMTGFAGARAGPTYENDPTNLVVNWSGGPLNTAPGGPSVAGVGTSSITVTFTADGADAYILRGSTAANFTGTLFTSSTTAQSGTLTLNNLALSTTYFLEIGSLWNPATYYASLPATVTLSTIPAPVGFSNINATSFRALWSQNSNPSGITYEVSVSTKIDHSVIWSSSAETSLFKDYSSLTANATYFFRVRALNWAGAPSGYASGAVVTRTGVITISANRLPGVWYNTSLIVVNAQGANNYLYSMTANPNDIPPGPDVFDGSALNVPTPQGVFYFHVLGQGGAGDGEVFHFGPVFTDLANPAMTSIAAQKSVTDATPIPDGGSTVSRTPLFTWAAASSVSPVAGYSFMVSTNAADVPPQAVNVLPAFLSSAHTFSTAGRYYAKVRALNLAGSWGAPVSMSFDFVSVPSVNQIVVKRNYFNPTRGECLSLDVLMSSAGRLRAELFTLLGERVATLADGNVAAGVHTMNWCGRTQGGRMVATGTFLLHIEAPEQSKIVHVVVVK